MHFDTEKEFPFLGKSLRMNTWVKWMLALQIRHKPHSFYLLSYKGCISPFYAVSLSLRCTKHISGCEFGSHMASPCPRVLAVGGRVSLVNSATWDCWSLVWDAGPAGVYTPSRLAGRPWTAMAICLPDPKSSTSALWQFPLRCHLGLFGLWSRCDMTVC